ncbi:S-adenosyl-L-methionine-dependent methyltransferase superfamily protein [Rhynchospora pubera]|uniref:S-adenosyl-L-methionine-dependent methyltransferase superfamily protein n=1 Tax=Rhynchospora pubera TaxID=906938 RepID=A0AAV8DF15_9POAL|nr:S-adenosyl-L-methionine-dependent methyltransferase superfamily protein [Rhynchospora pubera]
MSPGEHMSPNRGNIYIGKTSSPLVVKLHQDQFQRDFSVFLKSRFEELVPGGQIVLTFLGRNKVDIYNGEMSSIWGLVSESINSMVLEGLVEEGTLDSFNLPHYAPSMEEAKAVINEQGLFQIINMQMFESNLDPYDDSDDEFVFDNIQSGVNFAATIRSVLEPTIASHFGAGIVDELFSRLAVNAAKHLLKEKTKYPVLALCLKKKEQM